MTRKLCSIQKISGLEPIPNADFIEKAKVLGWVCVVKKGEFKVGDKVVFCEIDSILPEKPEFEFLRQRKFRIKTMRMRGQISQGIAFPLNILPDYDDMEVYVIGRDVTEQMGVTLHQVPIPAELKGLMKGKLPDFVPRTDETRVQLLLPVLQRYKGIKCYISEKVDGTSVSYFIKDSVFGVCSRGLELYETEGNAYWKMARELDIENKLRSLNKNIAIQGELFGLGIQKNPLNIEGKQVLFFNVFDIDKYAYYEFEQFKAFITSLGLNHVPILETDFELIDDIEELIKKATGKSVLNPKKWREGIVIRPLKEITDLQMSGEFNNGRLSFKVTNVEYLLENE